MNTRIRMLKDDSVTIEWDPVLEAEDYRVFWADQDSETMVYREMIRTSECGYTLKKATHVPHYFKVQAIKSGETNGAELVIEQSQVLRTPVKKVFHPHLEKLNRGLIAVKTKTGIFLSWRLMKEEVTGYSKTGLTGADFGVYRNGERIAEVTDRTCYLDPDGTMEDCYKVAVKKDGVEQSFSEVVQAWKSGSNYIDLPLQIPEGGITPAGETYCYHANDMSVGDVNGDGEYEYIVKWDPSNAHDVSHRGYTGNCILDCYQLDGTLLWRLDMGENIRAGAHYTQFMVSDFNLDGKAEMAVKTAPGTRMTQYAADGTVVKQYFITMPEADLKNGWSHEDRYVCSAADYRAHLVQMFQEWTTYPEVRSGQWPSTLEECFGVPKRYSYPLSLGDAEELTEYFLSEFAPSKSGKNHLEAFEGFIFKGPEYLTMFSGNGEELQTIPYPFPRVDDGLRWGDYAMNRIEPCNRVDRFLAGVAYLDGERPYLIMSRGYYTRATIAAYSFFENRFQETFLIDTGFVPMSNPFRDDPHAGQGTDPVYGSFAGQGNHSLATADVDGDGYQEIVYGAGVIDHDGSLLYSSYGTLPDGTRAKLGHGDAMHVASIDPDRPGLQIFNVFEGAKAAPYGYALRDAETGDVIFGEYAEEDLGRCMIGDVDPATRGYQVWVQEMYDCHGNRLDIPVLGTNQSIRWAGDLTTQVIDGVDYEHHSRNTGVICDNIHGILLDPENTLTNNGTKGNPCLIADVFGDFREELLLRLSDDSAIRIYTNAEETHHKLFTLMQDLQYRASVAWQNNCYNQPGYPSFYYGSDMDWSYVMPEFIK